MLKLMEWHYIMMGWLGRVCSYVFFVISTHTKICICFMHSRTTCDCRYLGRSFRGYAHQTLWINSTWRFGIALSRIRLHIARQGARVIAFVVVDTGGGEKNRLHPKIVVARMSIMNYSTVQDQM